MFYTFLFFSCVYGALKENSKTFRNRYLVCDKYFNSTSSDSPIFFYAGNEGDIVGFYNNSGFMFELAQQFGALVVFVEHRYYGKSYPDEKYEYQSVEQVLADFTETLRYLKEEKYKLSKKSALIVFGGSYGGMLASWYRMKYPNFIDGALAASAPVLEFQGMVDPESYSHVLTEAFRWGGGNVCVETIRDGFILTDNLKKDGKFDIIENYYHTCQHITKSEQVDQMRYVLENALNGMSYANYPTENSFLRPLPAWAVKYTCDAMSKVDDDDPYILLTKMKTLASVYYNYTGTEKCFNISWTFAPHISDDGWNYQACTQMVMPVGSNGIDDFLLPSPWNLDEYVKYCQQTYPGIRVVPYWVEKYYHGVEIHDYSNIIYSNGKLDPWSAGGVYKENIKSETIYAIVIPDGGHHVDLRFSSDQDTPTIKAAREQESKIIGEWIEEKKKRLMY